MPNPTVLYVEKRRFVALTKKAPVRLWRTRLDEAGLLASPGDEASESGSPAHRLAVVHASLKWADREEERVHTVAEEPVLGLPKVPEWTLLLLVLLFAAGWYLAGLLIALLGTGLAVSLTVGVLVLQTRQADQEHRDDLRQGAKQRVRSARADLFTAMETFCCQPFAWRRGEHLVVCCPDLDLLRGQIAQAEPDSPQHSALQAQIDALEGRIEALSEELSKGWTAEGLTSELAVSDEDTMAGSGHRPTTAAPPVPSGDEIPEELLVPDHLFEQAETSAP